MAQASPSDQINYNDLSRSKVIGFLDDGTLIAARKNERKFNGTQHSREDGGGKRR